MEAVRRGRAKAAEKDRLAAEKQAARDAEAAEKQAAKEAKDAERQAAKDAERGGARKAGGRRGASADHAVPPYQRVVKGPRLGVGPNQPLDDTMSAPSRLYRLSGVDVAASSDVPRASDASDDTESVLTSTPAGNPVPVNSAVASPASPSAAQHRRAQNTQELEPELVEGFPPETPAPEVDPEPEPEPQRLHAVPGRQALLRDLRYLDEL